MANIYSGMSSTQKDNERKYLNSLVSGGGGNAEWAKSQLKQLDASSGSSNKTGSTLTTMRGTGSGSSSKSYSDTLKENITNSVKNPSDGVYSSLSNNSMIKDMETAYKSSGGNKTDNSIGAYLAQSGVNAEERYQSNFGDMGDELKYNPYEEYYREAQNRIEEMEAQIREQNRLAVEQGTNRLNAQKSNINQAADENARQAYIQYMQSQKALPQQLASQGVSGGATETANLGLQTAYQNNVNTINQNKANRLQEIDNAIVDLQNTGDLSTVEQVLANNQAALDAYMNTFDKGVGYNQWANTFNASRVDANRDYEAQQLQAYLDAWNEQNKLLSEEKKDEIDRTLNGYYKGNFDIGYTSAITGIPEEYLYDTKSALELETKLKNAQTQASINNTNSLIKDRNSGAGSGGSKTNQTYTQVLNAIQDLNTTAGADYGENLASARYLLNSDLSGANKIRIMKQTNVRPEAYVKQMVEQGYSIEDVGAFVDAYTPDQEYRDALINYAYQR